MAQMSGIITYAISIQLDNRDVELDKLSLGKLIETTVLLWCQHLALYQFFRDQLIIRESQREFSTW